MSKVRLQVETADTFFAEALEMARRLDAGEREAKEATLAFPSLAALVKLMTPNRAKLLGALRRGGATSIRVLAKDLSRDYRGVHSDVAALREAGLIRLDDSDKIRTPWSRITAEMDLDAAA